MVAQGIRGLVGGRCGLSGREKEIVPSKGGGHFRFGGKNIY